MFTGRWLFLLTILVGILAYVVGLNVSYLDVPARGNDPAVAGR
jgi:hypothetical protein